MVKYSYLAESWDGVLELPALDDKRAIRLILTKEPGIVAIWRLALDHEIPNLGKCLRIWSIRDLSFRLLFNLIVTFSRILQYKNLWRKLRYHAKDWNQNWYKKLSFRWWIRKYRIKKWLKTKSEGLDNGWKKEKEALK